MCKENKMFKESFPDGRDEFPTYLSETMWVVFQYCVLNKESDLSDTSVQTLFAFSYIIDLLPYMSFKYGLFVLFQWLQWWSACQETLWSLRWALWRRPHTTLWRSMLWGTWPRVQPRQLSLPLVRMDSYTFICFHPDSWTVDLLNQT